MAKDYAKRVFTTTPTSKQKWRRVELWVIPILLLLCLVSYWVFTHKNAVLGDKGTLLSRITGLFKHEATPAPSAKIVAAKKAAPETEVHFDFYSELPNMQMPASPNPDDTAANTIIKPKVHDPEATPTLAAKNKPKYVVRFGEFNDALSASQHQVTLLLVGCDAEVVTIKAQNKVVYRVQRGPFVEEVEAKKLQQQLLRKGVESVLVKA